MANGRRSTSALSSAVFRNRPRQNTRVVAAKMAMLKSRCSASRIAAVFRPRKIFCFMAFSRSCVLAFFGLRRRGRSYQPNISSRWRCISRRADRRPRVFPCLCISGISRSGQRACGRRLDRPDVYSWPSRRSPLKKWRLRSSSL